MIRLATKDDRQKIVELRLKLQEHIEKSNPYTWKITDEGRVDLHRSVNEYLDNPDAIAFVYCDDGAVIGFIDGIIRRRTTYLPPVVGHIGTIFVDESHRRKGIGKKLVKKMCTHFEENNVDEVNLRYNIGNIEAESLWTSLGLRPVIRTTLLNFKEFKSNLDKIIS